MEVESLYDVVSCPPVTEAFNLMVQTVIAAEKSVYWLLFLVGSMSNNADVLADLLEAEKRFPFSDLTKVSSPDAECKDSGDSEDDSDDDDEDEDADVGDDSDNDEEDSSGEDDDDEQGDADSDSDANDEDDDDDDDDDEDDDDDDDEDDDDDDDDEEEEGNQPPYKKKK